MAEEINLIPQYEVASQTRLKVVRVSSIVSILLLLIIVGISGYYYYNVYQLKQEMSVIDSSITDYRSQITSLTDIEIIARKLYAKTTVISSILSDRNYFSILLEELQTSTPPDVRVADFTMTKGNKITLTGYGDSYNSIQDFINNLLANDVFTDVKLNSVGLSNNKDNGVSYFIVVNYDSNHLHKELE